MATDSQTMDGGPPTRADWAEGILRADILSGKMKPGERIKIAELVARYQGLSPTPLREALSRLAGSGLVEFVPQRGVRVAKGSKEDLQDIYEMRLLLEIIAFRRSLAKRDPEWEQEVRIAFNRLEQAPYIDSPESTPMEVRAWEEAHHDFHFALLSRCGSPWLLRLVGQLYEHSTRYRNLSLTVRGTHRDVMKEHEKIFTAALSGDKKAAVMALEDHLKLTVTTLSESLE